MPKVFKYAGCGARWIRRPALRMFKTKLRPAGLATVVRHRCGTETSFTDNGSTSLSSEGTSFTDNGSTGTSRGGDCGTKLQ